MKKRGITLFSLELFIRLTPIHQLREMRHYVHKRSHTTTSAFRKVHSRISGVFLQCSHAHIRHPENRKEWDGTMSAK